MFFGQIIKENKPFLFDSRNVEETVGDVICISNVALAPASKVLIIYNIGKCNTGNKKRRSVEYCSKVN